MVDVTGLIDLQTCANIFASVNQDNYMFFGAGVGVLGISAIVLFVLYTIDNKEKNLMKNFLRRQGLLNKYEDWKAERRLGD